MNKQLGQIIVREYRTHRFPCLHQEVNYIVSNLPSSGDFLTTFH